MVGASRLKAAVLRWVVLSSLLVTIAAACGGGQGDRALTVYSGRSKTLVQPIIQQFGQASGASVLVKYASTSQLAATLLEEGDRTPADVFLSQDPGGLAAVQHLLAPLNGEVLELVPVWARSPDGRWVGLSGRARTVVYNTENLTEADLPDNMFGFTSPEWKGRIGWAPSNASFQTMVSAMRSIWGEDRTRRWLEGIEDNDPKVYPKNTPIVAAAGTGEIDVGFVNHYYLHRFLAEEGPSFKARNYHLRGGGPGAVIMVSGVGILEASDNQELAHRFVEFMLSQVAQEYFAAETFEYPLTEGVEPAGGPKPLTGFDHPDVTVQDLADLRGTQDLLRDIGILP